MKEPLNIEDKIDLYLKNKLSPDEKTSFEQQMEKDRLLKSEIKLQKDIIASIKQVRVLQIKQRLNSIDVAVNSGNSIHAGIKFAAVAATGALIATGIYLSSSHFPAKKASAEETVSDLKVSSDLPASQKQEVVFSNNETTLANTEVAAPAEASANQPVSERSARKSTKLKSETSGNAQQPRIVEENGAEVSDITLNESSAPNIASDPEALKKVAKEEVEISNVNDGKHQFHYQYAANRLVLYGNFGAKPYELLEFNKTDHKALYLFHDKHYYEINETKAEIAKLQPLTDAHLVKELDIARIKH